MATISPTRRPLQSLNTNIDITPRQLSSHKAGSLSPLKANPALSPAAVLASNNTTGNTTSVDNVLLNPGKKRTIDDVIAEERDQTRASFSSLINFDPSSSDNAEPAVLMASQGDSVHRSRANTLKLRLKMAMFRVQTNQMQTPFAQLKVPNVSSVVVPPLSRLANVHPRSSLAAVPTTPPPRIRSGSTSSIDEDVCLDDTTLSQPAVSRRETDITSSVIRGNAVNGLLELKKGS